MRNTIIAIAALFSLIACKPEPILQPVLDDSDRELLLNINKYLGEGDSLLKLAKSFPDSSELPLSYDMRIQYADMYFKQATEYLENAKKMRYIADEIFAMKLKMYNARKSSKDTIIPEQCKPCYEKLNSIESHLGYAALLEGIPNSLSAYSSELNEVCSCINGE